MGGTYTIENKILWVPRLHQLRITASEDTVVEKPTPLQPQSPQGTHVQAVLLKEASNHDILVAPQGVVDEIFPTLGSKHPGGHVPATHRKAPAREHSQESGRQAGAHTYTHKHGVHGSLGVISPVYAGGLVIWTIVALVQHQGIELTLPSRGVVQQSHILLDHHQLPVMSPSVYTCGAHTHTHKKNTHRHT